MFYGWVIVACVFIVQLFMVGFYSYGFSVLVDPVTRDLITEAPLRGTELKTRPRTKPSTFIAAQVGGLTRRFFDGRSAETQCLRRVPTVRIRRSLRTRAGGPEHPVRHREGSPSVAA